MVSTENTVSQPSPKHLSGPYTGFIAGIFVFLLCFSYMFNSAVRQIFPMLMPWISKTYGFNLQNAGLISTVFSIGSCISGIPVGYVLDHFSRKIVMEIGLGIYSIFTLLTTQAHGFWPLLVCLVISGVGEGIQIAGIFAAIGGYFTGTKARALSSLVIAYGLGGFWGPQFGTKLTLAFQNNWRIPLILIGLAGVVMVLVIQFFVPKKFTECTNQGNGNFDKDRIAQMPKTLWNRNVFLCAVAALITGFSLFGFCSLYATFLIQVLKFPPMSASFAFSFFGIGGIMAVIGGIMGDRFKQNWVIIVSFACVAVVSYIMYNVAHSLVLQSVLTFLVGTFCSGFLYLNVSALTQRSVRPEMIGRASGIFVTAVYLSAAVSGVLFGKLVSTVGWSGASVIELSLFPIVGIVAMLLINPQQLLEKSKSGN